MTLYLVRHAMPAIDPGTDPATWPLSDDGRAAARALRAVLPSDALLLASDEPKAWQTLAPDGEREVPCDSRLGEVRRTEEFRDDFRVLRRRYVSGEPVPGWEPRQAVAGRFAAAVRDTVPAAGGRHVVLGTHGMAMTVWLTQAVGLPDPGSFWANLTFPAVLTVDIEGGRLERVPLPAR